ncbi:DUF805 domain-containing protein [Alcanivorax sp.]|jgi:uncharacterized membrane protein YhaH (DUF805 family)|uniref:DUF805 domain-containing protein n=1 Tax=Alcanivorax sp. TaxID=1872427 RepID=UPI0032D99E9D
MGVLYGNGPLKPGYQGKGTIVYEPLSVLSLWQRLGRLRFACYQFGASFLAALLITLFLLMSVEWLPQWVGWAAAAVVSLVLVFYQMGLMVRRLHDMAMSGWWVILISVPLVNVLFQLYLYLGDGSSLINRFGTPNPPPSAVVLLVGGLCWLSNVLTLLIVLVVASLGWFIPELLEAHLGPYLPQWAESLGEQLKGL